MRRNSDHPNALEMTMAEARKQISTDHTICAGCPYTDSSMGCKAPIDDERDCRAGHVWFDQALYVARLLEGQEL